MRMSETEAIYREMLKPIPRQDEIMGDIQKQIDDYAAQCNGTDNYYRHPLAKRYVYTDGVKLVAELCGAYWLIDSILFRQHLRVVREQEFQVWKIDNNIEHNLTTLTCDDNNIEHNLTTLTCDDGNGNEVFREIIPFTDFTIKEIKLYLENDVLYLPCER